ncbi:MAG: redoxin domain-containing protein [Candidatus Tectomicrobia bacterium]
MWASGQTVIRTLMLSAVLTALLGFMGFSSLMAAAPDYMAALGIQRFDGDRDALDFTLATVDGKKIRLRDLKGKVVLLNFWATW